MYNFAIAVIGDLLARMRQTLRNARHFACTRVIRKMALLDLRLGTVRVLGAERCGSRRILGGRRRCASPISGTNSDRRGGRPCLSAALHFQMTIALWRSFSEMRGGWSTSQAS